METVTNQSVRNTLGRMDSENKMPLMWLASYPKSGNTWLRFVMAALIQPSFSSSAEVKSWIPDVHEANFKPRQVPQLDFAFAKTHYQFRLDLPYLEQTAGFIYIFRNPVDVLISNYNYLLREYNIMFEQSEMNKLKKQYVESFIKHAGDPRWVNLGYGNWVRNLESWLEVRKNYPSLFIKYESMKANPSETIEQIANFIGLNKSREDIQHVVDSCSFSRMQQLEQTELAAKTPGMFFYPDKEKFHSAEHKFVRKGRSDFGKTELSQPLRAAVLKRFKPVLDALNYEVEIND